MPTLYHYSPLLHLPPILREGLSRGEIAPPDFRRTEQAVSLTTQPDPDRILCWGSEPLPFKSAVRYVCRIPDGDPRLEPARDAWRRLGVPPKNVRELLDPNGQGEIQRIAVSEGDARLAFRKRRGSPPPIRQVGAAHEAVTTNDIPFRITPKGACLLSAEI